jgi:tetratricopeptide (TPR) repeat protein
MTSELTARIADTADLAAHLARDLEAIVAVWHRDRRGDPDAAEHAYTRALAHEPANAALLSELAKLQRRARGRPLVDSLLRLSESTGGDLDLLSEAAEVAVHSIGDRALARSIFDRLLKLAAEQWLGMTQPNALSSGNARGPENYVERANRELVRIHGDDGNHAEVVDLLLATAHLPWETPKARAFRHEAARVAVEKLGNVDRAITIYLQLIDEDQLDDEAVSALFRLYEETGRSQDLLALKRRLVGGAPSLERRLALRLEVASLEDSLGNVDGAIDALRESLA